MVHLIHTLRFHTRIICQFSENIVKNLIFHFSKLRIGERNEVIDADQPVVDNPSIEIFKRHEAGPLPYEVSHHSCQQFERAKIGQWLFTRQTRDNCYILRDATICIIENFLTIETINYLLVRKFQHVQDFYNVGVPSSSVGVYKCWALENETCIILFEEVLAKCYCMSFWRSLFVIFLMRVMMKYAISTSLLQFCSNLRYRFV